MLLELWLLDELDVSASRCLDLLVLELLLLSLGLCDARVSQICNTASDHLHLLLLLLRLGTLLGDVRAPHYRLLGLQDLLDRVLLSLKLGYLLARDILNLLRDRAADLLLGQHPALTRNIHNLLLLRGSP